MQIIVTILVSLILFLIAYRFYSPRIARWLGVDDARPTPAHALEDGVDYCPAKAPILFGHHFASIAGAAPIVGPIVAAVYGWLPALLWVIVGGIFFGAVHDFSALMASVRHDGRSIGEVIGRYLGRSGRMLFLAFLWATLVLLIAVYLVVAAKTFVDVPSAGTAAMLFILLALLFGVAVNRLRLNLLFSSVLGVALLFLCMVAGWYLPLQLPLVAWMLILIAYIFAASVLPVWLLLQPRDYLNSFLLFALLVVAVIGFLAARPAAAYPAFITWNDPKLGFLFPILFVTVACGAISGFHSVVASGTSSKQLDRESQARPIGFGAMLVESFVSVLAIVAVVRLMPADYVSEIASGGPVALFSRGVGAVLSTIHVDLARGTEFAALAVSAFVLTTLDTATRLCRYAFQEFFLPEPGKPYPLLARDRWLATLVTVAAAAALAFSGQWETIWPIFGAANQLLAALALLAVSLWLRHQGRRTTFLRIPMVVMFTITIAALAVIGYDQVREGHYALALIAAALFALAMVLVRDAASLLRAPSPKA